MADLQGPARPGEGVVEHAKRETGNESLCGGDPAPGGVASVGQLHAATAKAQGGRVIELWHGLILSGSREGELARTSELASGRIQVTESTFNLLKDTFEFDEPRSIEVKGVGVMRAYLLRDLPPG